MLLPDNVHPEQSIYYNGALVLRLIAQHRKLDFLQLYAEVRKARDISMPVFLLCLDWLYLIHAVSLDEEGQVQRCS